MKQRKYKTLSSLLLCGLLLLSLLTGCGRANQGQPLSQESMSEAETAQAIDPSVSSAPAGTKEETVYVQAAPDGSVQEITSEVLLKEMEDALLVRDKSTLRDIRNTVGDEEYLQLEDGTLLWENHGEDIHYKGTASGELPVSVKITYWLDGQEIAPDQLAGKNGRVRIRFDYENHTRQTVTTKDGEVCVCIPFAALTMVMLPGEHFTNVEVENGRLMDLGGESAVIGFALPGLSDSLSLSAFEPTEEMELPEYVELSADVTEFALDFTATVITPGLLDDLDMADLDRLDELREDMESLQDATDELTDGMGELAEGAGEFGGYLRDYTGGVGQISDGAYALAQGLSAMDNQISTLKLQLDELSQAFGNLSNADLESVLNRLGQEKLTLPDGTQLELSDVQTAASALIQDGSELKSHLETLEADMGRWKEFSVAAQQYAGSVSAACQSIPTDLTSKATQTAKEQVKAALQETGLSDEEMNRVIASIDLSPLTDPVDQARKTLDSLTPPAIPEALPDQEAIRALTQSMQENMAILQGAAKAVKQQFGEVSEWNDLTAALQDLSSADLSNVDFAGGAEKLADGIDQLYSGAKALSDGAKSLNAAGSALNEGYGGLLDGMDALKQGMEAYNEEGISELTDLTGESYQTLVQQLRGLAETDGSYQSYSGLGDAAKGSVKFIIETDEIG